MWIASFCRCFCIPSSPRKGICNFVCGKWNGGCVEGKFHYPLGSGCVAMSGTVGEHCMALMRTKLSVTCLRVFVKTFNAICVLALWNRCYIFAKHHTVYLSKRFVLYIAREKGIPSLKRKAKKKEPLSCLQRYLLTQLWFFIASPLASHSVYGTNNCIIHRYKVSLP